MYSEDAWPNCHWWTWRTEEIFIRSWYLNTRYQVSWMFHSYLWEKKINLYFWSHNCMLIFFIKTYDDDSYVCQGGQKYSWNPLVLNKEMICFSKLNYPIHIFDYATCEIKNNNTPITIYSSNTKLGSHFIFASSHSLNKTWSQ